MAAMAAVRRLSGRVGQREDPADSTDSLSTTLNATSTVSAVTLEPVSSGQVTELPSKSLWEQICEEYEAELPRLPEGYTVKEGTPVPVSLLGEVASRDFNIKHYFPASHSTTASHTSFPQPKSETVDPKTCSPTEYLETFIFPTLLPGLASLLHQAKKEKCIERKRTKFIACDFLTEWLYNQNPKRKGEPFTEFFSIPYVKEWLKYQLAVILRFKNCVSGRRNSGRTSTFTSECKCSGPNKNKK